MLGLNLPGSVKAEIGKDVDDTMNERGFDFQKRRHFVVDEGEVVEVIPERFDATAYNRPLVSEALGVHPSQISEFRDMGKKLGVTMDFTKDGRALLYSAEHRRKVMKARGMFDKESYY